MVEVLIHSGVFNIGIKLWCLHAKWWFNLKVRLISLHKHGVTDWYYHIEWNWSLCKNKSHNYRGQKLITYKKLKIKNSPIHQLNLPILSGLFIRTTKRGSNRLTELWSIMTLVPQTKVNSITRFLNRSKDFILLAKAR